tara:strand:- start:261 stop:443 length:183 start_codon:yes stop_codon:yes gene_type:complete
MNNFLLSIKNFFVQIKNKILHVGGCSTDYSIDYSTDYSIINNIVFETDNNIIQQYRKKEV